ncbi:MAG: tRNA uridine-5-carboxymethylaminomethyl(34) synthesis GTPase MnmE [Magnetococcales bacterium]|nr:tRNA uridine-5-carboxymethylaminomethyl(34) synthesis GTPase MnmE [Magnetococcales bacterium]
MKPSFPILEDPPIAALATPPGTSAVAIIRLSGTGVLEKLLPLLHHPNGTPATRDDLPPRLLKRFDILDPATSTPLDQTLVVFFPGPHSYSGEDVIEIQGHGSPVVVARILECLNMQGIRPAQPGEFTRRACLNGKMDLIQAEAVATLINASSLYSAREAVRQMEGVLSQRIIAVQERLLTVLAHVEAALDFAEDDPTALPTTMLLKELSAISEILGKLLRGAVFGMRLKEGFRLLIAGRPNVGKSSLFNRLLGRKRAIVSPTPGTTRDCIESFVEIHGVPVTLLDSAGLRETDEPVESEGIRLTREHLREADGVLVILDATSALEEEDRRLVQSVVDGDQAGIVVWNKLDLRDSQDDLSSWGGLPMVGVSALTGTGMERLEQQIASMLLPLTVDGEGAVIMAVRQKEALARAVRSLAECEAWMMHGQPGEILALALRSALEALGELVGETSQEDLLDRIFATFCIGK